MEVLQPPVADMLFTESSMTTPWFFATLISSGTTTTEQPLLGISGTAANDEVRLSMTSLLAMVIAPSGKCLNVEFSSLIRSAMDVAKGRCLHR